MGAEEDSGQKYHLGTEPSGLPLSAHEADIWHLTTGHCANSTGYNSYHMGRKPDGPLLLASLLHHGNRA